MQNYWLAIVCAASLAPAVAAQAPPKRVVAPVTRFSIDTPIVQLLANPASKAALVRHMPTLASSPHLQQFEKISIRQLAANPHASIAAAKIKALQADLIRIR